jgi:ATP-dependent DNA helicase RecG
MATRTTSARSATRGTTRAAPAPITWDTPIGSSGLPGAAALGRRGDRLGIRTVRDLVFTVPRRWIDTGGPRQVRELRGLEPGTQVTARLELRSVHERPTRRRNLRITTALLADDTGDTIEAVWFGRQYIERRIGPPGTWLLVAGKTGVNGGRVNLQNPDFEQEGQVGVLGGSGLLPVYRLTQGIRARTLRRAIRQALAVLGTYPEYLDQATRGSRLEIGAAVTALHFPPDRPTLDRALDRMAYDELLALQTGMVSRRRARERDQGAVVDVTDTRLAEAIASVEAVIGAQVAARADASAGPPVEVRLTPDQVTAVRAVRTDMASGRPMMRLVQGDVGSGKTAVAALAMAFVADAGGQSALLAPTDLLARQHAATLTRLLDPLGHEVILLTASVSASERRGALELAAAPMPAGLLGRSRGLVFVGTQSLIGEAVDFADLRLAVVDEQHRFGVADRESLSRKGRSVHVLLMTATPIPQVLGQVLHADLDVTDLRAAPVGRVAIQTGIKRPGALDGTWDQVRREAASGHRTFVVVPLIEPEGTDDDEAPDTSEDVPADAGAPSPDLSAESEAARLEGLLAPLRVGMVHGRLKPVTRDQVMAAFRDGDLDVLVGTTVVEVGVDVPEATLMVIEGADRFGLAQLHQLRGRVGRGTAQSWCVLVSDAPPDSVAMTRLRAVKDTTDGFALAELDIELRREGELLGLRQSGLPPLRVADLGDRRHRDMTRDARERAEALVGPDGQLAAGLEAFERELRDGWLARIGAGDVLRADELDG